VAFNTGMSGSGIRGFTFTPHDGVPPAVAPFAHATAAGPTLYVTGQMPTDITGSLVGPDVATQTDQVLHNLRRVTELCGGTVGDVVQVRAYLLDWDDYAAFNAAYAMWFPDRLPSRTCVGVTGLAAGARVEIDWVCWRSGGWGTTIDL
jgi:2-iminobutanoate/2-iminopropanoate deaminase